MAESSDLTASVLLRKGGGSKVDAGRIDLLERIGRLGSIASAAREQGLSYKGAWDAVRTMNNLFERPLVAANVGGEHGGSAALTAEGEAVVRAFRLVEIELGRMFERLEGRVGPVGVSPETVFRSLLMKTSARNALRGVVETVCDGAVNAEVILKLAEGVRIVAVVTRESVEDLGLAPGVSAVALIKSSFVVLAHSAEVGRTSARNRLEGTVTEVKPGAVNSQVVIDLGGAKTLVATVTRDSAETLEFKPGDKVCGLVKAQHVILAVD